MAQTYAAAGLTPQTMGKRAMYQRTETRSPMKSSASKPKMSGCGNSCAKLHDALKK